MVSKFQRAGWLALMVAFIGAIGNTVVADSVVPIHLSGLFVNGSGFGRFSYGDGTVISTSPTLGAYESFVYDAGPDGGGGGVGWNFSVNNDAPLDASTGNPVVNVTPALFPYLDRAAFGASFNPDNYRIEVDYRPLENNEAQTFNIMLDRHNGFHQDPNDGGRYKRMAEQLQWGFYDIVNYHADNQGSDGFATISIDVNALDPDNPGQTIETTQYTGLSHMFAGGSAFQSSDQLTGPGIADLDAFNGGIPNGAGQLHLQSSFDGDFPERLHIEVRDIRFVPRNPDPALVARFDSRSGIARRFGTPFNSDNGGGEFETFLNGDGVTSFVDVTDQLQRFDQNGFTNVIIKTDDDLNLGGFGSFQSPIYQAFDGIQATLQVTARLTAPLDGTRAEVIDIVLDDMDGSDTGPGQGADEYKYYIDLNQFNETSMTTISIPLTDYDELQTSQGFTNSGNGSLEEFNLFYLGFVVRAGEGLVDLEIESVEIRVPVASADFDGDGIVDGHDFLLWQRGAANAADLTLWESQFGTAQNSLSASIAVPEPTSVGLAVMSLIGLGLRRRFI